MSETTEATATATHTVRSPGGQQDPRNRSAPWAKARSVIRESSPGFFSPKSELGRSDTVFDNAGVMLLGPVESRTATTRIGPAVQQRAFRLPQQLQGFMCRLPTFCAYGNNLCRMLNMIF